MKTGRGPYLRSETGSTVPPFTRGWPCRRTVKRRVDVATGKVGSHPKPVNKQTITRSSEITTRSANQPKPLTQINSLRHVVDKGIQEIGWGVVGKTRDGLEREIGEIGWFLATSGTHGKSRVSEMDISHYSH